MALAVWDDLVDIGAIPEGGDPSSPKWARAEGLLSKASAQVLVHLSRVIGTTVTETTVAGWPEADRQVIATVVAEMASRRLTSSAAATAQQVADGFGAGWLNSYMTQRDRDTLNSLSVVGTPGTVSLELAPSSLSGLTFVTEDPDRLR